MNQVEKAYGKKLKLQDYRHIYLYAKGHYYKDDSIEDLKVIIGARCNLEPQHVSTEEVFRVLLTITHQHMREDLYVRMLLEAFGIRKLFPNMPHEISDGIKILLANISHVQIYSDAEQKDVIVNLGKADSKILPLRKKVDIKA